MGNSAETHEANVEKFSIWTGNGTAPFYMQPETVLGIIERAPNTLEYLIFSELARIDEFLMNEYFIPMAEACKEQGRTKIFLRNKNSFWNGNVHMPEWYAWNCNMCTISKVNDLFVEKQLTGEYFSYVAVITIILEVAILY
ncbi:hypothetical protein AN642_01430 [Epulopiscium sp. SCG-B10WGA-EpuloA2]|nr:hypothetical protein AN642_01430 [Epulopiscium sp. SCG-B10WGA-EpuloA2]